MDLKQALRRIEELERRVRELEARPPIQQHNHYHYPQYQQPWYQPAPVYPYFTIYGHGRGTCGAAVVSDNLATYGPDH